MLEDSLVDDLPPRYGRHFVDLKAERDTSVLAVKSAHLEPDTDPTIVAAPLSVELARMAPWLGLERVTVTRKGKLASALASEVRVARALRH